MTCGQAGKAWAVWVEAPAGDSPDGNFIKMGTLPMAPRALARDRETDMMRVQGEAVGVCGEGPCLRSHHGRGSPDPAHRLKCSCSDITENAPSTLLAWPPHLLTTSFSPGSSGITLSGTNDCRRQVGA